MNDRDYLSLALPLLKAKAAEARASADALADLAQKLEAHLGKVDPKPVEPPYDSIDPRIVKWVAEGRTIDQIVPFPLGRAMTDEERFYVLERTGHKPTERPAPPPVSAPLTDLDWNQSHRVVTITGHHSVLTVRPPQGWKGGHDIGFANRPGAAARHVLRIAGREWRDLGAYGQVLIGDMNGGETWFDHSQPFTLEILAYDENWNPVSTHLDVKAVHIP